MLVGVIGGGQLGRMLAQAGESIDVTVRVLDPTPNAPAGQVCEQIIGDYDDHAALASLADGADVVTYEFENVPVEATAFVSGLVPVLPSPAALAAAQDRVVEKSLFVELGIATPDFAPVGSVEECIAALDKIGTPAILKSRWLGYDGKGQAVIRRPEDAEHAWEQAGAADCIVESFLEFDREVSIIAVRGKDGSEAFYPLVENHHEEGILRLSIAPAPGVTPELQANAEDYARRLLDHLDYVGVLALELFQMGVHLLANEMAPRVHNSGHWTIEGAQTSQFENHLRAITGMPLGSTAMSGHAAMLNAIGGHPEAAAVAQVSRATLHDYGKEARPGRKLGHITICADGPEAVADAVNVLRPLVGYYDQC